jgi:hypothetical protein
MATKVATSGIKFEVRIKTIIWEFNARGLHNWVTR